MAVEAARKTKVLNRLPSEAQLPQDSKLLFQTRNSNELRTSGDTIPIEKKLKIIERRRTLLKSIQSLPLVPRSDGLISKRNRLRDNSLLSFGGLVDVPDIPPPEPLPTHLSDGLSSSSLSYFPSSVVNIGNLYDSTVVNDAAKKHWFYKDDFNSVQGPFDAGDILSWINSGHFDGRENLQFRREDEREFKPLLSALLPITQSQLGDALLRFKSYERTKSSRSQRKSHDSVEIDEDTILQKQVCTEFDMPLDLSQLSVALSHGTPSLTAGVLPDIEMVILPAKGRAPHAADNSSIDRINIPAGAYGKYQQLETDFDWLQTANPAFSAWAINKKWVGCKDILIIPVHSILLKTASPILLRALEKQQEFERKKEFDLFRNQYEVAGTAYLPYHRGRMQCLIRTTYPETFRLILRRLYGHRSDFLTIEPILLTCTYYEVLRLGISTIAHEIRTVLTRVTNLDALIALTELTEVLELWDIFEEYAAILCDSVFIVLSGKRYLNLGPLGFRRLLASNSSSLDEIQLFIAAHLWLMHRLRTNRLCNDDFWVLAQRVPSWTAQIEAEKNQCQLNDKKKLLTEHSTTATYSRKETDEHRRTDLLFGNQIFIFSGIRFCHMSAAQLNEARFALRLDALLVDGLLRKLLGTELPRRFVPWTENLYFVIDTEDGLFPVKLRRKQQERYSRVHRHHSSGTISFFNHNLTNDNKDDIDQLGNIPIPYSQKSYPLQNEPFWAWTFGDIRPIGEACWAIEILQTRKSKISIGVASGEIGVGLLPNIGIPIPSGGTPVWYFNLFSREFYSGILVNDNRTVHCRLSMTPFGIDTWTRSVRRGDIVIITLSVGITSLMMTVLLFSRGGKTADSGASFNFPHHIAQKYRGDPSHRPLMQLRPWFELIDAGDCIGIPELCLETPTIN